MFFLFRPHTVSVQIECIRWVRWGPYARLFSVDSSRPCRGCDVKANLMTMQYFSQN